jgi:hypothetical protein
MNKKTLLKRRDALMLWSKYFLPAQTTLMPLLAALSSPFWLRVATSLQAMISSENCVLCAASAPLTRKFTFVMRTL